MSVSMDKETAVTAVHIHVGHNIPGYLPGSDVMCFDSVEDALEALRHEIKDAQDDYWERCEADGDPEASESCECPWCGVAADCEVALSAIADGDARAHFERPMRPWEEKLRDYGVRFDPPEGPSIIHWMEKVVTRREDCEIFAE